ncbi:hypothetical protein LINPERHAP2_LOCUS20857 [Linum perenne]
MLRSQSALWKGLSKEWNAMIQGCKSAVRDGQGTRFWMTYWVDSGVLLVDLVEEGGAVPELDAMVANFVNSEGQWDVVKLQQALPPHAMDLVIGMTPPRAIMVKICGFGAAKERLLTNSNRVHRHLVDSATCPFCLTAAETSTHVLRDCSFACEVWKNGVLFGVICWMLWKARNERVFSEIRNLPAGVASHSISWSVSIGEAWRQIGCVLGESVSRFVTDVAWDPGPPRGHFNP